MFKPLASPTQSGLHCQYIDARKGALAEALATVVFDDRCQTPSDMRYLSTGLPQLTGPFVHEHLLGDGVLKRGHSQDSSWAATEQCLVVALWANEADYDSLQHATEQLYARLLDKVFSSGYPHLVRIWNYFPEINRIDNTLERYRQFCIGRFDAFARHDLGETQFPSACALGNQGGDLVIYALASKVKPWHFENPRQASAYHYPSEYGPRSPSFARASLLTLAPTGTPVICVGNRQCGGSCDPASQPSGLANRRDPGKPGVAARPCHRSVCVGTPWACTRVLPRGLEGVCAPSPGSGPCAEMCRTRLSGNTGGVPSGRHLPRGLAAGNRWSMAPSAIATLTRRHLAARTGR